MAATEAEKAVAAQNAVTHGLTARSVVLHAHGKSPEEYDALRRELTETLRPRNALECHHVETIAAATWRLSRFRRWQTRLYEDGDLTEDERLAQIERALRHETALHRQIDRTLRALTRTLPDLLAAPAPAPAPVQTHERESRRDTVTNVAQICKNELPPAPPPMRLQPSDLWGVKTILPGEPRIAPGDSLAQQARQIALATGRRKK